MGQVASQSMSDGSLSEMGAADTGEPGSPGQASLLRDYAQAMSRVGQLEAKIAELMGGHTAPRITELHHQVAAVEGQSAERDRFKQGPDESVTYERGPSTESAHNGSHGSAPIEATDQWPTDAPLRQLMIQISGLAIQAARIESRMGELDGPAKGRLRRRHKHRALWKRARRRLLNRA